MYSSSNPSVGDPAHPPSAIKGNITSMMGKVSHNPQKQQDGNIMIANSCEQKAAKFETKALQWEQKGNMAKAQKNREKAARYRQKAIAKMNQPLTTPKQSSSNNNAPIMTTQAGGSSFTSTTPMTTPTSTMPMSSGNTTGFSSSGTTTGFTSGTTNYNSGTTALNPPLLATTSKSDKALRCEQKALEYERKGDLGKAQRNRDKAWHIREKNGIPHPVGSVTPVAYSQQTSTNFTTIAPAPMNLNPGPMSNV